MPVSMLFDMTLILLAGLLAGLAIWQIRASGIASRPGVIQDEGDRPVFLFDGDTLTDCTPAARRLIAGAPTGLADFDALVSVLGAPFPELRDRFERIEPGTEAELGSEDHPGLSLRMARHGDVTRLSLTRTDGAMQDFDDLAIRHRAEETAQLRRIVDQSAEPIWIEDAGGRLVWSNSAYLDLCDQVGERTGDRAWPIAHVFENLRTPVGTAPLRDRRVLRPATDEVPESVRNCKGVAYRFRLLGNHPSRPPNAWRPHRDPAARVQGMPFRNLPPRLSRGRMTRRPDCLDN